MSEPKRKPGRPPNQDARNFNVALHRIVRGECADIGGIVAQLSIITGLSAEAIRCRIHDVQHTYPPEELNPHANELSSDDLSYLGRKYGRSNDPAIREFMASIRTDVRRRPDSVRSSADRLKPSLN